MDADSYLQPDVVRSIAKPHCTADRASRSVEGRQGTVASRLDETSAEALDIAARHRVVAVEEFAPAPVANSDEALSGLDDVSEKHRRQGAIDVLRRRGAREE